MTDRKKRPPDTRRKTGREYEEKAADFLQERGYRILEKNVFLRRGEIDIVAEEGGYLVFCEVKYRRGEACGRAAEAVDARKQKKLFYCAMEYLQRRGLQEIPCRFDVVAFDREAVEVYQNAFQVCM